MPTELDHVAIIDRIIAILKNDSQLYDNTGAGGEIRGFFNGLPSAIQAPPYLAIYLLTENDRALAPVINNVLQESEHTFTYELLLIDVAKAPPETEQKILKWSKRIKEVIKGNYALQDPTANNDPKVFTCHPKQTSFIRGTLPAPINQPGIAALIDFELYAATS